MYDRQKTWVYSFGSLLLFLILAEVGLKSQAPIEIPSRWGEYPALEIHPTRAYALKPNLDIQLKYSNYGYPIKTNSMGLSSPELPVERPDTNTFRILVLGDAFSMPEGLAYEKAYPALMEQKLKAEATLKSIQVINGGVTGYGPNEAKAQLAELLPIYQPNIVVHQFFHK